MRLLALLASALIITIAHAADFTPFEQTKLTIFPPPEYDHPYKGKLDVHYVDAEEIKKHCPANSYGQRLGCTVIGTPTYCLVYIGPQDELEAIGYSIETIRRHEIGHCNGWPAHHPGMHALKPGQTPEEFNARHARWRMFMLARANPTAEYAIIPSARARLTSQN
jgi:hypothetical protein